MNVENKNRIFVQLPCVIIDKLSAYELKILSFLKSMGGFDKIDVSQNQIAKATGISKGQVNKVLVKLEKYKIIYRKKGKGFNGADVIIINDEDIASKWDPDFTYNSKRRKLWTLTIQS